MRGILREILEEYALGKKGQFDIARKSIFWMIMGVVITMAVLIFAFILSSYHGSQLQFPGEYEAKVISLRFLNTPECFSYQDPISKRVYPGVIDIDKYSQERLNDCYWTELEKGYKTFNFGLSLVGFNEIGSDGEEELLMTNNYFNDIDFSFYHDVIVRSGDEEIPSRLIVYVQESI